MESGVITPYRRLDDFREGEEVRLSPRRDPFVGVRREGNRLNLGAPRKDEGSTTVEVEGQLCKLVWDSPRRRLALLRSQSRLFDLVPNSSTVIASTSILLGGGGDGGAEIVGNPDSGIFGIQAYYVGMSLDRRRSIVLGPKLKPLKINIAFLSAVDLGLVLGAPDQGNWGPDQVSGSSLPAALTLWDAKTGKIRWQRPGLREAMWWKRDVLVLEPKPILISGKTGKNFRALPFLKGLDRLSAIDGRAWVYRPRGNERVLEVWSMPGLRDEKKKQMP